MRRTSSLASLSAILVVLALGCESSKAFFGVAHTPSQSIDAVGGGDRHGHHGNGDLEAESSFIFFGGILVDLSARSPSIEYVERWEPEDPKVPPPPPPIPEGDEKLSQAALITIWTTALGALASAIWGTRRYLKGRA